MLSSPSIPVPQLTAEPVKPGLPITVWVRRMFRLVQVTSVLLWAGIEITCMISFVRSTRRTAARASWLQRTCQRLLRCLNVHVDFNGKAPRQGMLVSNHLSYLDIIVLGSRQPMAFVSKKEVRNWPLIGWLTECAGTVYIDREQRSDVARASAALTGKVGRGAVICLFPEGTSSDGSDVLPFRPSLLQPAVDRGWTITPAHLQYELSDGSVGEEVCYWGDMSFGPHLLNLLGKREIRAVVCYGRSLQPCGDRKQLAVELRDRIRSLACRTSSAVALCEV